VETQVNTIHVLGTGTSTGIPLLGCDCNVCRSTDTRNHRLRTSVVIENQSQQKVIVDTGPDLRTQLLNCKINMIDAAIITHEHADHCHGIDDLRPFGFIKKESIPVYTGTSCAEVLRERFPYIFDSKKVFGNQKPVGGGIPKLHLEELECEKSTTILNMDFEFYELPHGRAKSLCFRQDKFAYIVDCSEVPDEVIKKLEEAQLEVLIIDCLRPLPHTTHLHLEKSLEYIKRINPKFAGLIHMSHYFDHQTLLKHLNDRGLENVKPLIDGERLTYRGKVASSL